MLASYDYSYKSRIDVSIKQLWLTIYEHLWDLISLDPLTSPKWTGKDYKGKLTITVTIIKIAIKTSMLLLNVSHQWCLTPIITVNIRE